ncbi:MAG: suppressor of fused domain protein [Chloroflexi bacterium]|nr:suppressor of fused domain protein [Chloroflexota bacterium]OJW06446.1 MAG: hypothetical protein BGO39_00040 [Chloroflexi bacterium 54-19]
MEKFLKFDPATVQDYRNLGKIDLQLLDFYDKNIGNFQRLYKVTNTSAGAPDPIFIAEYTALSKNEGWDFLFVTVGTSREKMPYPANWPGEKVERRVELVILARTDNRHIALALGGLAESFFRQKTFVDVGHTVQFENNDSFIPGSPLTGVIFTYPYFTDKKIGIITLNSKTHVHLLWCVPVYNSERLLFKQQGIRDFLVLISEKGLDIADFGRPSALP